MTTNAGEEALAVDVLHSNAELLVLNKPAGLSVLKDRSGAPCLWDRLPTIVDGKPYLVHRLDKPTSGVLIVARSAPAQARLTKAFQARRVRKFYLAWVVGDPGASGEIDLPLKKGRKNRFRVAGLREDISKTGNRWQLRPGSAFEDGHDSRTRFRRLAGRESRSLLLLMPATGRTHQLRVHLAWIGHPIVGDLLYGSPDSDFQAGDRLQLHAHRLVVPGQGSWSAPIGDFSPLGPG
ncbi:MAG: RNA pseudouridine synthase [Pseudomonadota bacterium]